jgi:hypothetical protein
MSAHKKLTKAERTERYLAKETAENRESRLKVAKLAAESNLVVTRWRDEWDAAVERRKELYMTYDLMFGIDELDCCLAHTDQSASGPIIRWDLDGRKCCRTCGRQLNHKFNSTLFKSRFDPWELPMCEYPTPEQLVFLERYAEELQCLRELDHDIREGYVRVACDAHSAARRQHRRLKERRRNYSSRLDAW